MGYQPLLQHILLRLTYYLHIRMHRLCTEELNNGSTLFPSVAQSVKTQLDDVSQKLIGMADEVQGDQYWRYQKQVSHGMQEYIEALSLKHYLEFGTLISYDEVQKTLLGPDGLPVRTRRFCLGSSSEILLSLSTST